MLHAVLKSTSNQVLRFLRLMELDFLVPGGISKVGSSCPEAASNLTVKRQCNVSYWYPLRMSIVAQVKLRTFVCFFSLYRRMLKLYLDRGLTFFSSSSKLYNLPFFLSYDKMLLQLMQLGTNQPMVGLFQLAPTSTGNSFSCQFNPGYWGASRCERFRVFVWKL
jgi:hypothetical protein